MGLISEWRERRSARDAVARADLLFRDGDRLRQDGRMAEAEVLLEEAVRIRTARLGRESVVTMAARLSWARALRQLARDAEAEAELRDMIGLASARPALGKLEGRARLLLGAVLLASERNQEAAAEFEAFLDLAEQHSFGKLPLLAWQQRAVALTMLGRSAEAAGEFSELAAAWTAEDGPGNVRALKARSWRATNLVLLGKYAEVEAECRDLIQAAAALDDPRASVHWSARTTLAFALVGQGRAAEGEARVREAIELVATAGGPDRRTPFSLSIGLAQALNAQHKYREALDTAEAAEKAFADSRGYRRGRLASIGLVVGSAQLGLKELEVAWQTADQALADCHAALGPHHHRALELGTLRGSVLSAQGRRAEASEVLATNAAAWREHFGGDHPRTRTAEETLKSLG